MSDEAANGQTYSLGVGLLAAGSGLLALLVDEVGDTGTENTNYENVRDWSRNNGLCDAYLGR